MAQPARLRPRHSRRRIWKSEQFNLILVAYLQVQFEGSAFLTVYLSQNLKAKNLHVKPLRPRIVGADDGNVMKAVEHDSSGREVEKLFWEGGRRNVTWFSEPLLNRTHGLS